MYKIFIDGQSGTTGLQIVDRLQAFKEIDLLKIPENLRKDAEAKKEVYNEADLVILCLPDAAAREAVALAKGMQVKILDASTAHRTREDWVYGMPELNSQQRDAIRKASRVANPGCYPTGFILAMAPLVDTGIVPKDYPVSVNAVSGYSGGGKSMIETYQSKEREGKTWPFRPYAFSLRHKHVPEMQLYAGLERMPLFVPSVDHFYNGMLVMTPLWNDLLKENVSAQQIHAVWTKRYADEPFVNVMPFDSITALENGFLSPLEANGTNRVDLFVFGNEEQSLLIARLDNLGKGASGAAVQNMNLMLGLNETEGLV